MFTDIVTFTVKLVVKAQVSVSSFLIHDEFSGSQNIRTNTLFMDPPLVKLPTIYLKDLFFSFLTNRSVRK